MSHVYLTFSKDSKGFPGVSLLSVHLFTWSLEHIGIWDSVSGTVIKTVRIRAIVCRVSQRGAVLRVGQRLGRIDGSVGQARVRDLSSEGNGQQADEDKLEGFQTTKKWQRTLGMWIPKHANEKTRMRVIHFLTNLNILIGSNGIVTVLQTSLF